MHHSGRRNTVHNPRSTNQHRWIYNLFSYRNQCKFRSRAISFHRRCAEQLELGPPPGAEIQVTAPGVQINNDGSATYFLTVTNSSPIAAQYHFRGNAIC